MNKSDLLSLHETSKINKLIAEFVTNITPEEKFSIMDKSQSLSFGDFDYYFEAEGYMKVELEPSSEWMEFSGAHIVKRKIYPNYMLSQALCWDIEYCINKKGLVDKYLQNLKMLCLDDPNIDLNDSGNLFKLIHTSTENKCKASLLAVLIE